MKSLYEFAILRGCAAAALCASLAVFEASWASASEAELAQARQALAENRFEEARAALEPLTADAPDSAELHFLLGKAESGLGNHDAAVEKLETAIRLDDSVAEYHAQLGSALIAKAQSMNPFEAAPQYMRAVELYRKAVAVDPANLHGRIGLCRYYWNAPPIAGGSFLKAKEQASAIEKIDPYLGKTEFALIARQEGQAAEAILLFAELDVMRPGQAWIQFELGNLYRDAGDAEKAKAAYGEALKRDPSHAEAAAALAGLESP